MKDNLNDFELAMVSGGGNATFSQEQLDQNPNEFFKTFGVSTEDAKKQCPGEVRVSVEKLDLEKLRSREINRIPYFVTMK